MSRSRSIIAGLALFASSLVSAEDPPATGKPLTVPEIPFTRFTLANGLTVVVHEDHKAPLVSVNVTYRVGSADEPASRKGFAHLFEHLMFSGSEHQRGSYFQPFQAVGVSSPEGSTVFDRTYYSETVPTTALDMALWMESDRMGYLLGAIGQEELDAQRGVVKNEKREREGVPYGRQNENIFLSVFPLNHPYHELPIGRMKSLDAGSLGDVRQWFGQYYGAANATLVLVGDVTVEAARAKVERYFGEIPGGPPVPRQQPWVTPLKASRQGVQFDAVPQPMLVRTWVTPEIGTTDATLLDLAARVLGDDDRSRLNKRLVDQQGLSNEVSADLDAYALAGLFTISVSELDDADRGRIAASLDQVLRKFLRDGPTPEELTRAKTNYRVDFIRSLERVSGKAEILSQGLALKGDPALSWRMLEQVERATSADIAAAARRWLGQGSYQLVILPPDTHRTRRGDSGKVRPRSAEAGRPAALVPAAIARGELTAPLDRQTGVPQVTEFPEAEFPAVERGRLSNGVEVALAQWHGAPVTGVALSFDGGFAADGDKPGIAITTTVLMSAITRKLNALPAKQQEQLLGEITTIDCSTDSCTALLSATNEQLPVALKFFADIVRHPTFDPADAEQLIGNAAILEEKADPAQLAERLYPPLLYGAHHPYGVPASGSGTEKTLSILKVSDLKAFHQRWIRPDNMKVMVAGDITLEQILPQLEAALGDWQAPAAPLEKLRIPAVAEQARPRVFLVDRPNAEQSMVVAAVLAPSVLDPDGMAVELGAIVLCGDFTSRLNMNLREQKHWAYGASCSLGDTLGQRALLLSASVQTDKTAESMREVFREVGDVVGQRPLTGEEVDRAKQSVIRGLPSRYETSDDVLSTLVTNAERRYPDDFANTLKSRAEALTADSVNGALKSFLRTDALTWIVIGDLRRIEKPVRQLKFGEVTVLDADGKVLRRLR